MKKYIFLLLIALSTLSALVMAQPFTFDKVKAEMLYPDYWIAQTSLAHEVILNPDEIIAYNNHLRTLMPDIIIDITAYPEELSDTSLLKLINTAVDSEQIKTELNLQAIKKINIIQYGFVVTGGNLRTFPTMEPSYASPDDSEFDLWQETRIDAATPILILHTSKNEKFYYIQTNDYRGWIMAEHVAFMADKQAWLDYQQSKDFLIITGNEIKLNFNPNTPELSQLALYMGQKIPLANNIPEIIDNQTITGSYVVLIPIKNKQGKAEFKQALISVSQEVSKGYIPYTKANVIKQAFKMLGHRYSWGGANYGRDCSSFIQSIYASMGFQLPRNTSQQILIPKQINDTALQALETTALLFTQGHVLLYLGKIQDNDNMEFYAIHDLPAMGTKLPNTRIPVNAVVVTPLSTYRKTGKTIQESLIGINMIE